MTINNGINNRINNKPYNSLEIIKNISSILHEKFPECEFKLDINNSAHGDICINAPILISKKLDIDLNESFVKVRDIILRLYSRNIIDRVEFVNGFCNVFFSKAFIEHQLTIASSINNFGQKIRNRIRINIEYVSPNATGPLHIGHLRSVCADILANILEFLGYSVTRECYINDLGNQIDAFEQSVLSKYNNLLGIESDITCEYKGSYIDHLAGQLYSSRDSSMSFREQLIQIVVNKVKEDLEKIGIKHDIHRFESRVYEEGYTQLATNLLSKKKVVERKILGDVQSKKGQGSGKYMYAYTLPNGESKVLFRDDMTPTYIANDLGYFVDKIRRGYDKIIIMYGADHVGQIEWLKSAFNDIVDAGNYKSEFIPLVHEIVTLKKDGQHFAMSKRSGVFLSAEDVINSLDDPLMLRFFLISKSLRTKYCIDVDEIIKISKENKFFYMQYAYARASSILREATDMMSSTSVDLLHYTPSMMELAHCISIWPAFIDDVGESMNPQYLIHYMEKLSRLLHQVWNDGQYNTHDKIIVENEPIRTSRLCLIKAFANVMSNCMHMIGIAAYEKL